jgi:hypothetical protein
MDQAPAHLEHFYHVRIIVGMVLSLSIARLLAGVARFIQHPGREQVFLIHLGWVAWMLLSVIYFWWWEFALSALAPWTFAAYAFFIGYAAVFFLLCTLLFPDDMKDYHGFADYFMSRRRWFFGLMAFSALMDVVDTALKGHDYWQASATNISTAPPFTSRFASSLWSRSIASFMQRSSELRLSISCSGFCGSTPRLAEEVSRCP